MAPVISSDGSFTPPRISEPRLVLSARYSGAHDVDLRWEWAYQVGDAELRAAVGSRPAEFRDPAAEARVLAGVDLDLPERARFSAATLHGLDTMVFSTEVLPLLSGRDDVRVEVSGRVPDYREAGDSLRIGVSAAELDGEQDWFDLGITVTVEGREVPFAELFVALASGQSHLLLPDGAYFSLDKPELVALARLIEEARALTDQPAALDGPLRISRFQAGLWDELAGLGVVRHQAAAWQRQVQGLLLLSSVEHPAPPAALDALLRPYQRAGFQWLAFLWQHGLGGILADDMGLGKTLQTLALLSHAKAMKAAESGEDVTDNPFLIVAPTSVLANWATEARRFTPDLKVVTIGDTLARRGVALESVIAGADAVVTSYTLLRLDFESYGALPWAGLVLDEAQYVKNHQLQGARVRAEGRRTVQGGDHRHADGEQPDGAVVAAVDHRAGAVPEPGAVQGVLRAPDREGRRTRELLGQLRRRIRPLIMRRTKEQVAADLPEKQEQVLEVELHPRHRRLYQTHLQRERQKVLGLLGDVNHNRFTILRSLTLLRQLALHAALVDDAHGDVPSAKIDSLLEQLEDVVGGGHRALVFSQFTRFLRMVRGRLEAAGVPYCYLDGSTVNRPAVISAVQGGNRAGVPDQPQGRRLRAEPHRGRLLLPARSLVEPGDRGAGRRQDAPHRPDPQRDGVPADRFRHDRGEGHGAQGAQGRAVLLRDRQRRRLLVSAIPRRHPRPVRLAPRRVAWMLSHGLPCRHTSHAGTASRSGSIFPSAPWG